MLEILSPLRSITAFRAGNGTIPVLLFLFLCMSLASPDTKAQAEQGCYTIAAGRAATADGSVLVGHNEDNSLDNLTGMRRIARATHDRDEWFRLPAGGRIAQVEETFAYWWLAMDGLEYSDAVLNETGVAVVSNSCPSREDRTDVTDGGIGGPALRILVAERARTAREGVELIGSLVESLGYTASGRTMIVADAREVWLVALVQGRRWVAARVPDDEAAIIANTYTIGEIDLEATDRFLASPDIEDYAVKRGWYKRDEGPFSFEKAYAAPDTRVARANTHRQWSGLLLVAKEVTSPERQRLPFSVKPKTPLTLSHITRVLRDHYENAPVRRGRRGKGPVSAHRAHTSTVCCPNTNSSSIFQLRAEMPAEIGALWWCSLWQPCTGLYVPLYNGMDGVPGPLAWRGDPGNPEAGPAYKTFGALARWVEEDYSARIGPVKKIWSDMERACFGFQKPLEEYLLDCWKKDGTQAREVMSSVCLGVLVRATEKAGSMMSSP
jgi:dipeptidase